MYALLTLILVPFSIHAESPNLIQKNSDRTSRLLVFIHPGATFSSEEFSKVTSAIYLNVDPRNPYKKLQSVFLESPFVVTTLFEFDHYGLNENSLRWLASRFGYQYVIFKKESLEEAILIANHLLKESPKFSSDITPLTLDQSTALYNLMQKIDKVFSEQEVNYWAGRETLLGAIRHHGLMPWDDYLYLYILERDEKKLKQAHRSLEKLGLVLHSYQKGFYKIYEKQGVILPKENNSENLQPFNYPAANIFVMSLERNGDISLIDVQDTYVHRSDNFYAHWTHDRFDYSQIETVQRIAFGPITISIPGDPEAYLNKVYGTEKYPQLWKKYAFQPIWNHLKETHHSYKGALMVEIDDYSPAPWR